MTDNSWDSMWNMHELIPWLEERIKRGEVTAEDLAQMMTSDAHDVTTSWQVALYALGGHHLVPLFNKVEIRTFNNMIGLGMMIHKDVNPEQLPFDDKVLMTKATAAVLALGGLYAEVIGSGLRIHGSFECRTGCVCDGENHDFAFENIVNTFMEEVDAELGPSVDEPPGTGWGKWM